MDHLFLPFLHRLFEEEVERAHPGKLDILRKGHPCPREQSVCQISITPNAGESVLIDVDLSKYNDAPVIIGDLDFSFGHQLSDHLCTMFPGEKAMFLFNVEHYSQCYIVELKSFVPRKQFWTNQEIYDYSVYNKEKGNAIFRERCVEALVRYEKALRFLKLVNIRHGDTNSQEMSNPQVQEAKIRELRIMLHNNISTCLMKEKHYADCIAVSSRVLMEDPNNEKALYKSGVSLFYLGDYTRAVDILQTVVEYYPGNTAAKKMLRKAQKRSEGKEVEVLDKAFVKFKY